MASVRSRWSGATPIVCSAFSATSTCSGPYAAPSDAVPAGSALPHEFHVERAASAPHSGREQRPSDRPVRDDTLPVLRRGQRDRRGRARDDGGARHPPPAGVARRRARRDRVGPRRRRCASTCSGPRTPRCRCWCGRSACAIPTSSSSTPRSTTSPKRSPIVASARRSSPARQARRHPDRHRCLPCAGRAAARALRADGRRRRVTRALNSRTAAWVAAGSSASRVRRSWR